MNDYEFTYEFEKCRIDAFAPLTPDFLAKEDIHVTPIKDPQTWTYIYSVNLELPPAQYVISAQLDWVKAYKNDVNMRDDITNNYWSENAVQQELLALAIQDYVTEVKNDVTRLNDIASTLIDKNDVLENTYRKMLHSTLLDQQKIPAWTRSQEIEINIISNNETSPKFFS